MMEARDVEECWWHERGMQRRLNIERHRSSRALLSPGGGAKTVGAECRPRRLTGWGGIGKHDPCPALGPSRDCNLVSLRLGGLLAALTSRRARRPSTLVHDKTTTPLRPPTAHPLDRQVDWSRACLRTTLQPPSAVDLPPCAPLKRRSPLSSPSPPSLRRFPADHHARLYTRAFTTTSPEVLDSSASLSLRPWRYLLVGILARHRQPQYCENAKAARRLQPQRQLVKDRPALCHCVVKLDAIVCGKC